MADNELSPFEKLETEPAVVDKLKFCDGTPTPAGSCGDVPLKPVRSSELCSNGTEASTLSFVNAGEIEGWSHWDAPIHESPLHTSVSRTKHPTAVFEDQHSESLCLSLPRTEHSKVSSV